MRTSWPLLLLLTCLVVPASLMAQEPSSPASTTTAGPQTPQAATILQQAVVALTGGSSVTDVTMTGTVATSVRPNGSAADGALANSQSGTVTFVATARGQSQSTITTSAGTRVEIRDISGGWPKLTVVGTDGTAYDVTTQSALSPHPDLSYPAFIFASGLSSPIYASAYIGQGSWNGTSAQHLSVWMIPSASWTGSAQQLRQITQHDIYLDASSLLPVCIKFTVHPYDPANPNSPLIPRRGNSSFDSVEQVQFSQYQQVQGRPVPFHIHTIITTQFVTILSDVQLSSVSFNTGATVSAVN